MVENVLSLNSWNCVLFVLDKNIFLLLKLLLSIWLSVKLTGLR